MKAYTAFREICNERAGKTYFKISEGARKINRCTKNRATLLSPNSDADAVSFYGSILANHAFKVRQNRRTSSRGETAARHFKRLVVGMENRMRATLALIRVQAIRASAN